MTRENGWSIKQGRIGYSVVEICGHLMEIEGMNEILVEAAAGESGKIWIIRKYLVRIALKL